METLQDRFDTSNEIERWLYEIEPTHFLTFIFNRNFASSSGVEPLIEYSKQKLDKFCKYLNKKLLGKYWYRIDPNEHFFMVSFPQNIHSNLHYHGVGVVKNTKTFPNKVEMFETYAKDIWTMDKERTDQETNNKYRDVIVPNGDLDIQRPRNNKKVIGYSVRDEWKTENHNHFFVSGERR